MSLDRITKTALRAICIVAVTLGLWLTLRGVSMPALVRAVGRTNPWLVASGALPLLVIGYALRTARFAALLPAALRPSFFELGSGVILSVAANNVLPLRAGELVRTRETVAAGVGLRRVAFAQVAEKVIEAVALTLWAAPALASYMGHARPIAAVVALTILVAAVVASGLRYERHDLLRAFALSAAWSFLADAVEVALIALCLHGVGLPAGLAESVTVFAAVNIAIALPSTPGNVGAFEAGAALPLIALGTPGDAAIAFALVYRLVQWLPVNVAGAILWARKAQPRRAAS